MKFRKHLLAALTALTFAATLSTAFAADQTIKIPSFEYEGAPKMLGTWFTGVSGTAEVYDTWQQTDGGGLYQSIAISLQTGGSMTMPQDGDLSISSYEYTITQARDGTNILKSDWLDKAALVEVNGKPTVPSDTLTLAKGAVVRFPQAGQLKLNLDTADQYYTLYLNVTGASLANYTVPASAAKLVVNGKATECESYTIGDNNYFKLRDIAAAVDGTEKQFSVTYDEATQRIILACGAAYTATGGELSAGSGAAQTAKPSPAKALVEAGESRSLLSGAAFEIAGNNYFMLRDLGKDLNFSIGWDEATSTITVDTTKGYYTN